MNLGAAHDRRSLLVCWFGRVDLDRVRRGFDARNRSPRSVSIEARRAFEPTLRLAVARGALFRTRR
jgi:hypothetical protein